MVVGRMRETSQPRETTVLRTLQWVFFGLGLACTVLFALDPDIHAHPQFVLLGGTGLLGALSLRVLRTLLRDRAPIELD